jgi:hypothetical protein
MVANKGGCSESMTCCMHPMVLLMHKAPEAFAQMQFQDGNTPFSLTMQAMQFLFQEA